MAQVHFIGIDVGTGSARAGVFDATGTMLAAAKHDIVLFQGPDDIAEQSSEDIWQAVASAVRTAVQESGVDPSSIGGIGMDATCSLVVLGPDGAPLPVGDAPERDIIVWMDHRATAQAARINATRHPVLNYVGGTISPEMQTPKLLWLKENRPQVFAGAWQFFDLVDYLTWRATGSLARSICTLTCKWTYLGHEGRWDPSFFEAVGLGELSGEGFKRIGTEVVPAGTSLGRGLQADAARDFGLPAGVPVGAGLIDAHAGGLGTVGARGAQGTVLSRLAYVFGTSACTMASTREPAYVPGVWGPYFSSMIPGLWLNEGGQSAAGAAMDHLVRHHPASIEARRLAEAQQMPLLGWLAQEAGRRGGAGALPELVGGIHVVPEFLGNRSPLADPAAKALIAGLGMDTGIGSLIGLYLAGLAGLGYGTRQILQAQEAQGVFIDTIVVSGGAAQNPLVRQILADATGVAVAATKAEEPVLLGASMLGALAGRRFTDAAEAMAAMSELATVYQPNAALSAWHTRRAEAFERLQGVASEIRRS